MLMLSGPNGCLPSINLSTVVVRLYSLKCKNLKNIKDFPKGSEIIISNDGSNNKGKDGSVPASGTNKDRDIAFIFSNDRRV
jgi:hypothetical protein